MNCLQNYVKVKGCGDSTEPLGCWVHEMPGLSSESFEKIANAEQESYVGAFESVEKSAINSFRTALTAKLASKYKLKRLAQSVNLGRLIDAGTTTAQAAEWRGFTLDTVSNRSEQGYVQSPFHTFRIQTLSVYSAGSETNVEVAIFDLETGDKLFTSIQNLTAGWNTVQVNENFAVPHLFCAYDSTSINSVTQELIDECGTCNDSCCAATLGAKSSKTATVVEDDVTTGQDIYGLTGVWSLQCSFDALVCNNLDLFGDAYSQLFASKYCTYAIHTKRMNHQTLSKEQLGELKDHYDVEFEKKLTEAVDGVSLNLNDCCLECNAPITQTWVQL